MKQWISFSTGETLYGFAPVYGKYLWHHFPDQAPPVVLAIQMGGLKPKDVVHFLLLVTLASILVLLPINFLWWRLVG